MNQLSGYTPILIECVKQNRNIVALWVRMYIHKITKYRQSGYNLDKATSPRLREIHSNSIFHPFHG